VMAESYEPASLYINMSDSERMRHRSYFAERLGYVSPSDPTTSPLGS